MKVELGCGSSKTTGYIGVDISQRKGVDIVADLSRGLPFPDDSISEIKAVHLFEHISDTVGLMKEIYRVCSPGARVTVEVPFARSDGAFADPTHVSFFTEDTWDYFDKSREAWKIYELECDFRIISMNPRYLKGKTLKKIPLVGKFLRRLVRRYFARVLWNVIFSITVEMEVVKPPR